VFGSMVSSRMLYRRTTRDQCVAQLSNRSATNGLPSWAATRSASPRKTLCANSCLLHADEIILRMTLNPRVRALGNAAPLFRPTQFVCKVGKCTSAGECKFDPLLLVAVALLIRVPFPSSSTAMFHVTQECFTSNVASVNDNRGNSIRKSIALASSTRFSRTR